MRLLNRRRVLLAVISGGYPARTSSIGPRLTERRLIWRSGLGQANHRVLSTSIYKPLDSSKSEIRLLRIGPGRREDDVSCQLDTVSLHQIPQYDTLSYTWGNPNLEKSINVNDRTVKVTKSLFDALRSVRNEHKTVTLWADALCIDQKNDKEKSTQVAMMDQVYSKGRRTWISLGLPSEDWANGLWSPTTKVEQSMSKTRQLFRHGWSFFKQRIIWRRSRESESGINHISDARRLLRSLERAKHADGVQSEDETTARSLLTWLANNEYWTRVWIVQEVALSYKDPICLFGQYQIPLLALDTVLRDWRGGSFDDQMTGSSNTPSGLELAIEVCLLRDEFIRNIFTRRTWHWSLVRCFEIGSQRQTSSAHDHIYGLYNLLSAEDKSLLPLPYTLSVPILYASLTRIILAKQGSAKILCSAIGIQEQNGHRIPTWAIDFSKPVRFPAVDQPELPDDSIGSTHETGRDPSMLTISGQDLKDSIISVQTSDISIDEMVVELTLMVREWEPEECAQHASEMLYHFLNIDPAAQQKPSLVDFLRLLSRRVYQSLTDQRLYGPGIYDTELESLASETQNLDSELRTLMNASHAMKSATDDLTAFDPENATDLARVELKLRDPATVMLIAKAMAFYLDRRSYLSSEKATFFFTKKGRLGKSTGEVQVDDTLWTLSNSDSPFILRQRIVGQDRREYDLSGNIYALVGPCLVTNTHAEDQGYHEAPSTIIELV